MLYYDAMVFGCRRIVIVVGLTHIISYFHFFFTVSRLYAETVQGLYSSEEEPRRL
jgi:hypothetical protein